MRLLRYLPLFAGIVSTALSLSGRAASNHSAPPRGTPDSAASHSNADNTLDVSVLGMTFTGPQTARPGWTLLRLKNTSAMLHFAVLQRLPDGRTVRDHQAEVAPVFQNLLDNINGRPIREPKIGVDLPEWFAQIVFVGGPGMLSAQRIGENFVYLEPGTYLLECYVKTAGVFHSYSPSREIPAMVHQIEVSGATHAAVAPAPTVELSIHGEHGLRAPSTLPAGEHIVSVNFRDQRPHENYLGHDVHLVRLHEQTDLDRVAQWMDWTRSDGLETPEPAEFLGGTHEMPAGSTAYFRVDLEPGDYAWVAEVPGPEAKGMLQRFTVPDP